MLRSPGARDLSGVFRAWARARSLRSRGERCAPDMHPLLELDANPHCVEQILAFKRCHEESTYAQKLLGECNEQKRLLDACFKSQKKMVRKDILAKARADRERWRRACDELEAH